MFWYFHVLYLLHKTNDYFDSEFYYQGINIKPMGIARKTTGKLASSNESTCSCC